MLPTLGSTRRRAKENTNLRVYTFGIETDTTPRYVYTACATEPRHYHRVGVQHVIFETRQTVRIQNATIELKHTTAAIY